MESIREDDLRKEAAAEALPTSSSSSSSRNKKKKKKTSSKEPPDAPRSSSSTNDSEGSPDATTSSSTATGRPKQNLLELAENSMAMALMLYLLSNLRALSATGRVGTKYEYLSIDSDKNPRRSARDFAGYSEQKTPPKGITAAHMVAVFFLEIAREAEERSSKEGNNTEESPFFDADEDDGPIMFQYNNDVQSASGMHALLNLFQNMIATDIGEVKKVKRDEYPLKQDDDDDDEGEMDDSKNDENRYRRSKFAPEVVDNEEEGLFDGLFAGQRRLRGDQSRRNNALKEIAKLQESMFLGATSEGNDAYSKQELKDLLQKAIETRDFAALGFIKDFFKEGSISRLLAESKAEMVWLNDWNSQHECTYGIAVDKEKKQVFVSFRGCFTKTDWKHTWDWNFLSTSNPIKEDYPGRSKSIKLHGGFHKYLFRARKDTGTTKYDEICTKIAHYCERVGAGVQIIFTGHSLGAALSTIVSFYASTDARFTRYGAIQSVNFGGPWVGGYKFADAVRYQESVGKLLIARIHNVRDGVTHLPPALWSLSKRGALYFNNGIDVRLHYIRKGIFKIFPQPQPSVTYNGRKSFVRSLLQHFKDFYLFNMPLRVWLSSKMHSLVEHKDRICVVYDLKNPETSPLIKYSLEELYEMREDLAKRPCK